MKFTISLQFVAFAFRVAAESVTSNLEPALVQRDVPTVTNVLKAVGSGIVALDNSVLAYTGGDSAAVDRDAAALQSIIITGTSTVKTSSPLTANDAVAIAAPVLDLQAQGQKLVKDLIAKRAAFQAARICKKIESQTTGIQSASQALIDAIIHLVPSSAQTFAGDLAKPFQEALTNGAAAFTPENCTDAAPTGPSTAAASSTKVAIIAAASPTAAASDSDDDGVSPTDDVSDPTSTPSPVQGTGSAANPTISGGVEFTGVANVNRAVNFIGVVGLAAAALAL